VVPSQVFEIVVRRHQNAVRRFLTEMTKGDTMLADDLAQEAFIKAFYAWDTFQAVSSPKTWLMRIAYTTFIDHTRSQHLSEDIDELSVEDEPISSGKVREDIQMDVARAMQLLSHNERLCVNLSLVEDCSIREVAKITGLNENTVKSHLKRGKEKLKTYLSQNGYDR